MNNVLGGIPHMCFVEYFRGIEEQSEGDCGCHINKTNCWMNMTNIMGIWKIVGKVDMMDTKG